MLRKCWHRENDVIHLYKGSTPRYANGGVEALSEVYASQIAATMGLKHVEYKLTTFQVLVLYSHLSKLVTCRYQDS